MTDTSLINYEAKLVPFADGAEHAALQDGSWFITFGLGRPAASTYTEVVLAPSVREADLPEAVLEVVVRGVAAELYGSAYAFMYRPEQYESAIGRFSMRRRERVAVIAVEVYE